MRPYRRDLLIAFGLAVLTLAAFWNVRYCDFVNFDDGDYVTDNRHVLGGLTWANVRWALGAVHAANWHPLTWLSLQLDATLHGPSPAGFHTTNLILHVANTVLLFVVFRAATGAAWRSALVAALFGVHPLHVESVAWVSERKDVLSTLFWILTLGAYVWYTRRPGVLRYAVVGLSFILGLMAKPMLVTLPCVLLLLDYWPLARLKGRRSARRLLVEKLPLFALSAASCIVTLFAQRGALNSFVHLPLETRLPNTLNAYASYLGMTFWPRPLWVLYVHPLDTLPFWRVALAAGVLILVTFLAIHGLRHRPYLAVGWLWYLGTLVPVIGLVQVGSQAMADRYTYVPLVGIFILLAWGLPDLLTACKLRPTMLVFPVLVLLLACVVQTRVQVGYWRNSGTLWGHALKYDRNSPTALNNYGNVLLERGDIELAAEHFRQALRLRAGTKAEAASNLGMILSRQGRFEEAATHYLHALELQPDMVVAHSNLGLARLWLAQPEEALPSFRRAVELQPDRAKLRFHLAYTLNACGQTAAARAEYQEGLRLTPGWPEVLNQSAWIQATSPKAGLRAGFEAVLLAEEACQAVDEAEPRYLDTLAAAYAEVGPIEDALRTARRARDLARPELARRIEDRIRQYELSEPYRDGK